MHDIGRRRFLAAGATTVATVAGCTQLPGLGGDESTTGTPAAGNLSLQTLDVGGSPGKSVAVNPSGEVVLLDFFATWCKPCKPQMAELRTVRSNMPDVHMLSITWENERTVVREFWQQYEGTWPVAMDTELKTGQQYNIDGLPTMLILDPNGKEVWRHTGLATADTIESKLEAARK